MTAHPTDARELARRILDDSDLEAKHGSLSMLVPIYKMRALCSAVLEAPDAAPATVKVEADAAKPREGDDVLREHLDRDGALSCVQSNYDNVPKCLAQLTEAVDWMDATVRELCKRALATEGR